MSTQRVIPIGLYDRPNQYGVLPEGAMSVCQNVFMRKAGTLQPQPSLVEGVSGADFAAGLVGALLAFSDVPGQAIQKVLALTSTTVPTTLARWINASGGNPGISTWVELTTGQFPLLIANRPFWVKHRNRFFILTDRGVMVQDYLDPQNATERQPRFAGMEYISSLVPANNTVAGGIYLANQQAAYRGVFRRVQSDGYAITSQPTPPSIFAVVAQGNCSVGVAIPATLKVGDLLEIYRTKIVADTVDPGPTFYLALSIPITAALLSTFTQFIDAVPDSSLGLELYTNPGQEGEAQDNRQPPLSKNIAMYKGFAFYGNLTQPPRAVLKVPKINDVISTNAGPRAGQIGTRSITGTTAIGSAVITGISAADIIGASVGQLYNASPSKFSVSVGVVSVGPTTVTMSANATAAGSHVFSLTDQLFVRQSTAAVWTEVAWIATANALSVLANTYVVNVDHAVPFAVGPTSDDIGISVSLEPRRWISVADGGFEFLASNGQNYAPQIPVPLTYPPSTGQAGLRFTPQALRNQFQWSKDQQPEACPAINVGKCGSGDILGLASTRDATFFLCTDGIFRLSGSGGQWRLDPLDSTLVPAGPQAIGVMRDNVYFYGNQGLIRLSSDRGIEKLSQPRINALQGLPYDEASTLLLVCDEARNEVWFSFFPQQTASTWYIYNADTDTFTTRAMTDYVSAVRFAELGFNAGTGGLQFFGPNITNISIVLKQMPASPSAWLANTDLRFQPTYGKRAETVKQFQRVTHLFSQNASTVAAYGARWNDTNVGITQAPVGGSTQPDSRLVLWVPQAYAVAPSIEPGIQNGGGAITADHDYYGFVLEYEELTTQQRAR